MKVDRQVIYVSNGRLKIYSGAKDTENRRCDKLLRFQFILLKFCKAPILTFLCL